MRTFADNFNFGIPMNATFELHLFKNDIVPDVNTVLTDFEEADFSGYALKTGPAAPPPFYVTDSANAVQLPPHAVFQLSALTIVNTVYGFYVVINGPPARLLYCQRFDTPVALATVAQTFIVEWPFAVGQPAGVLVPG